MGQSIENDILEFAGQRTPWQQDLFRRALTQPNITASDLDEVMSLLRSHEGIETTIGLVPQPLSVDHVRFCEEADEHAAILSLSETKNVNRLTPDQELRFAQNGITLIYGDNGSGKSGYARILKQLCRARRDRPEKILGDVYAAGPQAPAQAKVMFSVGGEFQDPHVWIDGQPGPKALSRLTVFDAQTAPIYVDRQNQIEFLPAGLDVLPRVGSALLQLSETLDREISLLYDSIRQLVLAVPSGTTSATLLDRLNEQSLPTSEEIKLLAQWSQEDDRKLELVREGLAAFAQPAKAAAKFRRMKAMLDRIIDAIAKASEKLSDAAFSELMALEADAKSARAAAQLSASNSFKDDPFGAHVGSLAWRSLFRYAKEFSELAYPDESFPVVGADKKCVLCQQALSEIASDRLTRFHAFLEQSSTRDAEELESKLALRMGELRQLNLPTAVSSQADLDEFAGTGDEARRVATEMITHCAALIERRNRFLDCNSELPAEGFPLMPSLDLKLLSSVAASLETKAQEYDHTGHDENQRTVSEKERDELEARKLLSAHLPIVLDRLRLAKNLQKLQKCKGECDTTAISRKASALRQEHLTGDFERRLDEEVGQLGLSYLPLKVAGRSERGASFVGIALNQVSGARTASVLSEGEFRVLALACFFAEIAGIPGHDGIIIDDPVSSLDHKHIRQVARRLVREAPGRPQVIIFTHNLPFYYELLEAATESNVPVDAHWVQRDGVKACGIISADDAPWAVKKVKERIKRLQELLGNAPNLESCSDAEHLAHVKEFYVLLRETWERLVEERLLNGVVDRFEPGVKTQSLKGVIVEDPDYQKVFSAMAKASRYSGHDGAISFQTSLPSSAEMRGDLEALREYEIALKKRSTQAEERRKALEDPIKVKSA